MNFLDKIIIKQNFKKALAYWNKHVGLIKAIIKMKTKSPKKEYNEYFKWGQLVWQEIEFYIRENKDIEINEFNELCKMRGFDLIQKQFLYIVLLESGLKFEYPDRKSGKN